MTEEIGGTANPAYVSANLTHDSKLCGIILEAKDMSIFKPDGKVITFSIWAESEDKLYKILTEKDCKDITILKSTNEEWTPEWQNSESDVEEKEIKKRRILFGN